MKRVLLLMALLAGLCAGLQAQTYTTVTGSNLTDLNGNKLAQGTICFLGTDQADQPVNFALSGGGQVLRRPSCFTVTNGTIAAGAQIPNPATTSPSGILYRITVTDTQTKQVVLVYNRVSLQGSSWDFDTYQPFGVPVPPPPNPANVTGPLNVAGDVNVTGTSTLGMVSATSLTSKTIEQIRYADQFPGVDAGAKVAACLADLPTTGGICDAAALSGNQVWSTDVLASATGPFVLRLGAGTVIVTHAQTMSQPGVVVGQGASTRLEWTPTTGTWFTFAYGSTSDLAIYHNPGLRDLRLIGPGRSNLGVVAIQLGPSSMASTLQAYGLRFANVTVQGVDTVALLQSNAYDITFNHVYSENTFRFLKAPGSGITNAGEHIAIVNSDLSDGGVAVDWEAANGDLMISDTSIDYDSGVDGSGSTLGDVYATAGTVTLHGVHFESSAPHDYVHAVGTASVSVEGWNGVSTVVASQSGLSASRSSNAVTVAYTAGSLPYANEPISVGGCADASFNGDFTVASATQTTITYNQTAAGATTTGCTVAVNWPQFFDIGGNAWAKVTGGQANMVGGRLGQIVFSSTAGYVTQFQNQPLQVAGSTGDGVVAGYNGPTANTPLSFNAIANRTDIGSEHIWLNGEVDFNGNFGTNAKFPYGYALNFGSISGTDGYIAGTSSGRLAIRGQVNGITIRNNADTADNVIFADDGTATFTGAVSMNDGGTIASNKALNNSGTINGIGLFDFSAGSFKQPASYTANGVAITNPSTAGTLALTSQLSLSAMLSAWSPGAIAGGACVTTTQSVANATTSMAVAVSPAADPGAGLTWSGWVSAAGTVSVRLCNTTAASITPNAESYNVRVIQ